MLLPAVTAAGALLAMEGSAFALTVVPAVELLLAELGAGVVDETLAVLLIVEPDGVGGEVCATRVNVAVVPEVSDARLQETVAPVVQVNVVPVFWVSETNVVVAGSVSVHETFAAFDGPLFPTVMA